MNKMYKLETFFDNVSSPKYKFVRGMICLVFNLLAAIPMIIMAYMPICDAGKTRSKIITAMGALEGEEARTSFYLIQFSALVALAVCFVVLLFMLLRSIFKLSNEGELVSNVKSAMIFSTAAVIIYTAFTFLFSIINRMIGGYSTAKVSYAALIYILLADLLFALVVGMVSNWREGREREKLNFEALMKEERKKLRRSLFWRQLELQIYAFAVATVAFVALLSKYIVVIFDEKLDIPDYTIKGSDMLFKNATLATTGERLVAFLVFVMFLAVTVSVVMSLAAFVSRSVYYSKFAAASISASAVACVFVGLFGQYYKVVQALNLEMVDKILNEYGIKSKDLLTYKIKSGTMIFCLIVIAMLTFIILRKPFSRVREVSNRLDQVSLTVLSSSMNVKSADGGISEGASGVGSADPSVTKNGFDPCPAFTEIDSKQEIYSRQLEEKRKALFESPTLPSLVSYIVQYARDCQHHLFYTPETIAAFLAGLGSTRLTILQGMSGTGKTSLPKIVAEALMSVCDIVEVESAWRDKNELLGYYNEFNKIYTPKKFTQALYRASLNSDTLTFIVLDEMNLSRIEYYFSDFLSIMEHDPDKREIKLLNTPLMRKESGISVEYSALCDGHTLKIPQNVWFIGTANRDESTYDISDKVYDRAHTMNFDKRAQKPILMGEPISARYLPASQLIRLFDEARNNIHINIDDFPVVKRTEELLEPYGISFGNRIAMQMESFVSIYASCFTFGESVIRDAFDTILLSKIVKKLELKIVDDKETLAEEFTKIGLVKCAGFVLSLKED